jgi:hypothetical protein
MRGARQPSAPHALAVDPDYASFAFALANQSVNWLSLSIGPTKQSSQEPGLDLAASPCPPSLIIAARARGRTPVRSALRLGESDPASSLAQHSLSPVSCSIFTEYNFEAARFLFRGSSAAQ